MRPKRTRSLDMLNHSDLSYLKGNEDNESKHLQPSHIELSGKEQEVAVAVRSNYCRNITSSKLFKYGIGGSVSIGTGLAMMPIFNQSVIELEKYGINIHSSNAAFIASTINTMLVTTMYSALAIYNYIESKSVNYTVLDKKQTLLAKAALPISLGTALFPAALLWNIEINNQTVAGTEGFDEFIAWAACMTLPLVAFKTIETYQLLNQSILKQETNSILNSMGSKLFTYGTSSFATIIRGIGYSVIMQDLLEKFNIDKTTATVFGIIAGVASSAVIGLTEYNNLKDLFKVRNENYSAKEILKGLASVIEGTWFSLPAVSIGLDVTEGWSPFIKWVLVASLLVSKVTHEATNFYNFSSFETPDQELIGDVQSTLAVDELE